MYTVTPKHITIHVQTMQDIIDACKDSAIVEAARDYTSIVFAVGNQQLSKFRIDSRYATKGPGHRADGATGKLHYIAAYAATDNTPHIDRERYDFFADLFAQGVRLTIRIFLP